MHLKGNASPDMETLFTFIDGRLNCYFFMWSIGKWEAHKLGDYFS